MEISTKKRIFGIDVYKTQFSMILCPNFRIKNMTSPSSQQEDAQAFHVWSSKEPPEH